MGQPSSKIISEKKPKHFLEVGVFCGVTSRNICELLNNIHKVTFHTQALIFLVKNRSRINEVEPSI